MLMRGIAPARGKQVNVTGVLNSFNSISYANRTGSSEGPRCVNGDQLVRVDVYFL